MLALASQQAVISDFYRNPQGMVMIDIVATVRDAAGQPLAVVVLRHDPSSYLYPLTSPGPRPAAALRPCSSSATANQRFF